MALSNPSRPISLTLESCLRFLLRANANMSMSIRQGLLHTLAH